MHYDDYFDTDDTDVLMCDVLYRLRGAEEAAAYGVQLDPRNGDACSICLEGGPREGCDASSCDSCPRVYHPYCLRFIDELTGSQEEEQAQQEGGWVCTWCRRAELRPQMEAEFAKHRASWLTTYTGMLAQLDEEREEEELEPPYGPARFYQFVAEKHEQPDSATRKRRKRRTQSFRPRKMKRQPPTQLSQQQQQQQQQRQHDRAGLSLLVECGLGDETVLLDGGDSTIMSSVTDSQLPARSALSPASRASLFLSPRSNTTAAASVVQRTTSTTATFPIPSSKLSLYSSPAVSLSSLPPSAGTIPTWLPLSMSRPQILPPASPSLLSSVPLPIVPSSSGAAAHTAAVTSLPSLPRPSATVACDSASEYALLPRLTTPSSPSVPSASSPLVVLSDVSSAATSAQDRVAHDTAASAHIDERRASLVDAQVPESLTSLPTVPLVQMIHPNQPASHQLPLPSDQSTTIEQLEDEAVDEESSVQSSSVDVLSDRASPASVQPSSAVSSARRPWDSEQNERLKQLSKDDQRNDSISKLMGRSVHAIKIQLWRLGIGNERRARPGSGQAVEAAADRDSGKNSKRGEQRKAAAQSAKASRAPWDAKQEQQLLELYSAGRSNTEICKAMGRSRAAIKTRRCKLKQRMAGGRATSSHPTATRQQQRPYQRHEEQDEEEREVDNEERQAEEDEDENEQEEDEEEDEEDDEEEKMWNEARNKEPPSLLTDAIRDRLRADGPVLWLAHAHQYHTAKKQLASQAGKEEKVKQAERSHADDMRLVLAAIPIFSAANDVFGRLRLQSERYCQQKRAEYGQQHTTMHTYPHVVPRSRPHLRLSHWSFSVALMLPVCCAAVV